MDTIDRAAEYEEQQRLAELDRRLKRPQAIGTAHCVDCGDTLCPERKRANPAATRCPECQHYFEKEQKHAHH